MMVEIASYRNRKPRHTRISFTDFAKARVAPVRFGYGYGLGDGTVRAVPVFGSGGSSKEGVFVCFSSV